jgi:beta-lactamase superfamily II metal-dependent hydrolase
VGVDRLVRGCEMTASKAEVIVLQCDQGMGTLVRIYQGAALTNLVLIDLGSDKGKRDFALDSVNLVMASLASMHAPRIDMLVISHQDYDHWSLLPILLAQIQAQLPQTTLGGILVGGQNWGSSAVAAVRQYEQHFGVLAYAPPLSSTHYLSDPVGQLADYQGVVFRLLVVNAPTRAAIDLERNGTSAVVVVEFGGNKAVIPGDATADTLSLINDIFEQWRQAGRENPVTPCFLLGVPHHGALRTLADNFTTDNPRLSIADIFAKAVQAERLAASAGYISKHSHPYKRVIDLLGTDVMMEAKEHTYVVYNEVNDGWEQVGQVVDWIYTTIATLNDPPDRKSWKFTMYPTGELSIESIEHNAASAVTRTPRHAARSG